MLWLELLVLTALPIWQGMICTRHRRGIAAFSSKVRASLISLSVMSVMQRTAAATTMVAPAEV